MYLIVSNNQETPVKISRKLCKELVSKKSGNIIGALSVSQIKGTNKFAIIKRNPEETFKTQCSLIASNPKGDRRTPGVFQFSIPSLEFIKAVSGMTITGTKIIKVKPMQLPNETTIYVMQI